MSGKACHQPFCRCGCASHTSVLACGPVTPYSDSSARISSARIPRSPFSMRQIFDRSQLRMAAGCRVCIPWPRGLAAVLRLPGADGRWVRCSWWSSRTAVPEAGCLPASRGDGAAEPHAYQAGSQMMRASGCVRASGAVRSPRPGGTRSGRAVVSGGPGCVQAVAPDTRASGRSGAGPAVVLAWSAGVWSAVQSVSSAIACSMPDSW